MRIDIITANPAILESSLSSGLIARSKQKNLADVYLHHLRDYAEGRYRQIDDSPYGGGAGMILKPEPVFKCVKHLQSERDYDEVIYLSPQGETFDQKTANYYSLKGNLILICGHYKGIDERIITSLVIKEISIGDFVISCGDIAALVFTDAVLRLIPGVLGDAESAMTDSFQTDEGFDAPQYTRPEVFEGLPVPEVLLSGNHKEIEKWRREQGQKKFDDFIKRRNNI